MEWIRFILTAVLVLLVVILCGAVNGFGSDALGKTPPFLNMTGGITITMLTAGSLVINEICPDPSIGIPDVDGFEENFGYSDEPEKRGIRYRGGIKVITDGEIRRMDDHLIVKEATYAEIYFTAETSFNGWNKHPYLDGKEYIVISQNDILGIIED